MEDIKKYINNKLDKFDIYYTTFYGLIIEYFIIFLLLYKKPTILIIVYIVIIIFQIYIYIANKNLIKILTAKEVNIRLDQYQKFIKDKYSNIYKKLTNKTIRYTNLNSPLISAPAAYSNSLVVLNKAYLNNKQYNFYLDGLLAHEFGHALSNVNISFLSIRITYLLSRSLKALLLYLIRSKHTFLKDILLYFLLSIYLVINIINYFTLYPILHKEEYKANSLSILFNKGEALRSYYITISKLHKNKYEKLYSKFIDLEHPNVYNMINRLEYDMHLTKNYHYNYYLDYNHHLSTINNFNKTDFRTFNYLINSDLDNPYVNYYLGRAYLHGLGTDLNLAKAKKHLVKALQYKILPRQTTRLLAKLYLEQEDYESLYDLYNQSLYKDTYMNTYLKLTNFRYKLVGTEVIDQLISNDEYLTNLDIHYKFYKDFKYKKYYYENEERLLHSRGNYSIVVKGKDIFINMSEEYPNNSKYTLRYSNKHIYSNTYHLDKENIDVYDIYKAFK